jgi:hypothetical protein
VNAAGWTRYPARPPGIAEWEEALLRMEIAARALRIPLDAGAGRDAAAAAALRERVRAERRTAALLLAMADGREEPEAIDPEPAGAAGEVERAAIDWLRDFERLRSRNFAMLQRRGLGVWDWGVRVDGATRVTAYQLLLGVLAEDAAVLGALRAAARTPGAAC